MEPFWYKSEEYFREYFEAVQLIEENRQKPFNKRRNPKQYQNLLDVKWEMYSHYTLAVFKFFHHLWLYLWPTSHWCAVLNVDVATLFSIHRISLPLCGMVWVMFAYYRYLLYQKSSPVVIGITRELLIGEPTRIFLPPHRYGSTIAASYVKQLTLKTLNFLQLIMLTVYMFVIPAEYYCMRFILEHSDEIVKFTHLIAAIIYCQAMIYFFVLSFHFLVQICNLFITLSVACFTTGTILFWQARRRLRQLLIPYPFSLCYRLFQFLYLHRRLSVLYFKVNMFYSQALLVFLLISGPVNCYLLIEVLIRPRTNRMFYYFLLLTFVQQWLMTFGIQFSLVRFNRNFRRPVPDLIHLSLHKQVFLRHRSNLSLSLYLQAFHCKKRYGICYGNFGVVSMFAFGKYVMIYTELLMYVYIFVAKNNHQLQSYKL